MDANNPLLIDRLEELLVAISDVSNHGSFADSEALRVAIASWPPTAEFVGSCASLVAELCRADGLQSAVHADASGDGSAFLIEMGEFLHAYGFPLDFYRRAGVNGLKVDLNRLLTLEYLITEVQALRMTQSGNTMEDDRPKTYEAQAATQLERLLLALNIPLNDMNPTDLSSLFASINNKLSSTLKTLPANYLGKPLLPHEIGPDKWVKLEEINKMLHEEYMVRRQMLLKRLDVTVMSFGWTKKLDDKQEALAVYEAKRVKLDTHPRISMYDVAAAKSDLARVVKTSDQSLRRNTGSDLNKHTIGAVPDRGGRPSDRRQIEIGFTARVAGTGGEAPRHQRPSARGGRGGGGAGGGSGHRGGRGGGGRVQGGWDKK